TGLEEDEDFDADQIGPGGITKLCEDLGVSLETVSLGTIHFFLFFSAPLVEQDCGQSVLSQGRERGPANLVWKIGMCCYLISTVECQYRSICSSLPIIYKLTRCVRTRSCFRTTLVGYQVVSYICVFKVMN